MCGTDARSAGENEWFVVAAGCCADANEWHMGPEIDFIKDDSTGVEIRSKRGGETAFTFLARDTQPPYVDTRPNLGPGPETRQYQAQYLDGDELVGPLSGVLVVTVPEK